MAKSQATKWTALRAYVDELQEFMNLLDWEIKILEAASDLDAWADIDAHEQAPTADLRVSHDFWLQDGEKQRLVLVHELLHLVIARYAQTTESLEDTLGKLAWASFQPQLENTEERAVEHLARMIAPFAALPVLPKA
jgi:hypothetical protein